MDNCSVSTKHTAINCNNKILDISKGRTNFKWQVEVDGIVSVETSSTVSYDAPTITSLQNHTNLKTVGNELVILNGANFGPTATYAQLNDANDVGITKIIYKSFENDIANLNFTASKCNVTINNTEMQCWSSSGVGKKFKWKVVLQDLESDYSDNEETKYTNAIIDNIQTPINQGIKPGEVTTVTITGSNFGPKLSEYGFDWPVTATYGQNVIDYNAANCTVTESHTTIQCYSVDAENDKNRINLKWQLTIATIQSPESSVTVNMSSPRLDSFVGTKHKYLATDGTDYITIKGTFRCYR
jgi:hypothetical protein